MTCAGDWWEDVPLPLDCDFDADGEPEPTLQLPPGWHFVIVGRQVRLARDLPDIADYNRTA